MREYVGSRYWVEGDDLANVQPTTTGVDASLLFNATAIGELLADITQGVSLSRSGSSSRSNGNILGPSDLNTLINNARKNERLRQLRVGELVNETFGQIVGVPFPTDEYDFNAFYVAAGPLMGIVTALSMMYPVSQLLKYIVLEKETRTKETMKIMGLKEWTFMLSWAVTFFLPFTFVAFISGYLYNVSVFPNSSLSLLIAYIWLFNTSCLAFGLFVSAFFSRAKPAGIVGPVILFVMVLPRYIFFGNEDSAQGSQIVAASMLSPTAYAFGIDVLLANEGIGRGVTWDNASDPAVVSFSTVMGMLFFDTVLYFFLAWYAEKTVPNTYGSSLPLWFPLSPAYWCPSLQSSSRAIDWSSPEGESVDGGEGNDHHDGKAGQDSSPSSTLLCREGGNERQHVRVAVNGLNLDLYEGEILSLLGHNGAGKTTTIGMLTGLILPTSGDARLFGKLRLRADMRQLRKLMGVCPQHNVLFDRLTCYEHLEFFGTLKGLKGLALRQEADKMLREVGLQRKRDVYSAALSGGMKRKLSVAIALLGSSKIVFLDEPTTGMDPYSRRFTWGLLRKCRRHRTVILTTHFMDEADILGDRIAIMVAGRLRALGTSLFLKSRFGVGYNLTLVKGTSASSSSSRIFRLVSSHIPDARIVSQQAGELSIQLPLGQTARFAHLFHILDAEKGKLELGSYGISMTTLEEVFIKIGHIDSLTADSDRDTGSVCTETAATSPQRCKQTEEKKEKGEDRRGGEEEGEIKAQEQKKARGAAQTKIGHNKHQRHPQGKAVTNTLITTTTSSNAPVQPVKPVAAVARRPRVGYPTQFVEVLKKRWNCSKRDPVGRFYEIVLPLILVAMVMLVLLLNISPSGPSLRLNASLYDGLLLETPESYTTPRPPRRGISEQTVDHLKNNGLQLDPAEYGVHESTNMSVSLGLPNTTTVRPEMTIMHNTTGFHVLPSYLAEYTRAKLQTKSGQNGADYGLSSHPLPLTARKSLQLKAILSLFAALFLLIPFCYIPATFVIFIVKERAVKAKHLQLVSGLSQIMYWAANYFWDVANYLVIVIGTMLIFRAYDDKDLTGDPESLQSVFLLFLLYGMASIPQAYCLSFLFENHTTAQISIAGILFVVGFLLVVTSALLDGLSGTMELNRELKFYYRFSPAFCFGEGLINQSVRRLRNLLLGENVSPWDEEVLGRSLRYLVVEAVVFCLCTLLIEYRALHAMLHRMPDMHKALGRIDREVAVNKDVLAERRRILATTGEQTRDLVYIRNLTKIYNGGEGGVRAVDNLCLGIPRGQCFGFLGINGAGKTTTLKMITGDIDSTAGSAFILNLNCESARTEVRRHMGYCPQFDPLFDLMTAREHIAMYARIRNVDPQALDDRVQELISTVGLTQYADIPAGTYSGGNKRKLSLALSLIGEPSVVFLDEPSSGMDPVSRRFMWDVIERVAKRCSVILTTHSMEECEALCGRIGIMVGGRLQCLGSVQHLKTRLGKGYQIEAKMSPEHFDNFIAFIQSYFPRHCSSDHSSSSSSSSSSNSSFLANIFSVIEKHKERLCVADYSVTQASLEQIFIQIASAASNPQQREDHNDYSDDNDYRDEKENERKKSMGDAKVLPRYNSNYTYRGEKDGRSASRSIVSNAAASREPSQNINTDFCNAGEDDRAGESRSMSERTFAQPSLPVMAI
eukprot:jgi/Bigna1/40010/e_gw1.38.1.1